MEGHDFFSRTSELLREGNTKGTEKWWNRTFCTHVKAGVRTKKRSLLIWMGKQKFGSHEFKKMESNGSEFRMVSCRSDQKSKAKIC